MEKIDDLPAIDIWPLIFRNLSLNDLFNCRLVNKKFKNFSDHSNSIYRLIVGRFYVQKYWSYNKELLLAENEDSITFKCFQQIRSLNLFNLNKNLKYLIIKVNDKEFDLDELSSFINLENLEIEIKKCSIFNKCKNLNLKNLTSFNFKPRNTLRQNFKINLNTPKLTMIKYNNHNGSGVRISNPESIKHLIIHHYDHKFEIFKNLEILELYSLDRIDSGVLKSFTKLRKIKFETYINIDTIENLLNYIKNLKRDIFIYYIDVKIENISKINEYKHFRNVDKTCFEYQIKNYNQLDSNLSWTHLEYGQLERLFNNLQIDLPASFFDKYVRLKSIYVCNYVNNNDLNWFLKKLKNLRKLFILGTSLDQDVYDNLPNTIRILRIVSSKNIENHDFIFKLTKLTSFSTTTDHIDLFDLGLKSFLNLKYLEHFRFYFNKKPIWITKFRNQFDLTIDEEIEKKRMNYEELVNLFSIFV